ncbi:MAG: IS3 family transposase [gamma proteobacterium symbiont of Lucinoma myriamae]|nr:IS3 family transposase [gamma proteobacterium symbiont of Lucinoma myriamae]
MIIFRRSILHFQVDWVYLNEYDSIETLENDVADYINFYNDKRFHQTLDYQKPMDVYLSSMEEQAEMKKAA